MGTILDRGYVRRQGQALVPEFLAFAVVQLLERHFAQLVDYEFTARMEDDLDEIAGGDESRTGWLRRFYFGADGDDGLKALVEQHLGDIDARDVNTVLLPRTDIVVRVGRYGPYLERGEARQTLPPGIAPDELTPERAEEILAQAGREQELGDDPDTGRTIVVRVGRYGPYVTELVDGDEKPRTASLFASMSPETVTLDEALQLLTLPRVLGEVDGEEVIADERPLRAVREAGQGVAVARQRGGAVHDHARARRWPSWPSRARVAGGRPRRRSRNWATIRSRASRSR